MNKFARVLMGLVIILTLTLAFGVLAEPAQAQSSAGMRLKPAEVEVDEEGDNFTVEVWLIVDEGDAVDAAAFSIDFNPNKLNVVNITKGSSFTEVFVSTFDNDKGEIDFQAGLPFQSPPLPPIEDDIVLATIEFKAMEATQGTPLELVNLYPDTQGNRMTVAILIGVMGIDPAAVFNGTVIIPGDEPPDTPTPSPTPTGNATATPTATPTPTGNATATPTATPTPAGNATPAIDIEIVALPEDEWPEPPEGKFIVIAFDYGPEGAVFDPPVAMTMAYDQDSIPEGASEEDLVMASYDSETGEWEILPVVLIDKESNVVIAEVAHLTVFAILGELVAAETPTPTPTETPEVTQTPAETITPVPTATPTPAPEPGDGIASWVVIVLVIGAIMVGAVVYMMLRRR